MNKESDRLMGTISLYFGDEIVTVDQFKYPAYKKIIIDKWAKLYQFEKRRDRDISFRVIYD